MNTEESRLVRQLVEAAQGLHESRLFERVSDHDGWLIRSPRLECPAVGVLMGYGGQTFGLNVFLGESAVASYQALLGAGGDAQLERAMMRSRLLGYEMLPAGALSHDARRWLKKAKVRLEAGAWYPDPMSLEPGRVPTTMLGAAQASLLLHLVRGVLAAAGDEGFKPSGIDGAGRVLCVTLDDSIDQPRVALGWETTDVTVGAEAAKLTTTHVDLSGLASSGDRWMVTLLKVPGSIEGDDRQPMVLVVASERQMSLFPMLVMSAEPAAVVDALADLMRGQAEQWPGLNQTSPPPDGVPKHLAVDGEELCEACRLAFEPWGVTCVDGSSQPGFREMVEDLHAAFSAGFGDADEDDDSVSHAAPRGDDLDGWKRADGWLKGRIFKGFDGDKRFRAVRALRQYFGPDAEPMEFFERFAGWMVVDSYAFWFAVCYRSKKHAQTLAEQWLEEEATPEGVKALLRAIAARGPGLYRVEEADEDTGKITLSDVFSGELTIASDFALSTCVEPGWLLPAWLVPAGDFHLYYPAGPILSSMQLGQVLGCLESLRIDPSPEAFRGQPHLWGRLWQAVDQDRQRPIELRNTDGHPLLFHTAFLHCDKPKAFVRALARQRDIEPDGESTRDWIWYRLGTCRPPQDALTSAKFYETYQEASVGQVTLLAEFHLDPAGQLTLKVNSRERLDAALDRLEKLGPLELVSCQTHPMSIPSQDQEPSEQVATDAADRPNDKIDPEMLEAVQGYLLDHYRQWLDQPLPALNGRTPREAAHKPKLRPQLAAMIRAMPDPLGPSDPPLRIPAPRQMLLAELGLD